MLSFNSIKNSDRTFRESFRDPKSRKFFNAFFDYYFDFKCLSLSLSFFTDERITYY
jgi:hypothetical protein